MWHNLSSPEAHCRSGEVWKLLSLPENERNLHIDEVAMDSDCSIDLE
jgi:hypothetical protein